jgi:CRP-like cAMP-binding protein
MSDLKSLIVGHAFLQGIAPDQIALLEPGARRVRFAPGVFIVRDGEVSVESAGQTQGKLQTAGPGGAPGWSWLVPPSKWHFTCRAMDALEALERDTAHLRQLAEQHPQLGYELARRLTQVLRRRLQATRQQLVGFYGQS